MSLFTVDKSLCKGDGRCSQVCPVGLITMSPQGYPVPVDGADGRCINCGHCLAVCPQGALSLQGMPVEDCVLLPQTWNPGIGQVEYFLKGRRSIRVFKKDIVEPSVIERVIDSARYAPSGINRQPVRWVILHDTAKVKELARETIEWMKQLISDESPMAESLGFNHMVCEWEKGNDVICRGAPHMALLYGLKDDMTALNSCIIAGEYFELAALPYGLGTCWVGYATMALNKWPPAARVVNISPRCSCFVGLLVGYPLYRYMRIPQRNKPNIIWR